MQDGERRPLNGLHGPAGHRDGAGFARVDHGIIEAAAAGLPVGVKTWSTLWPAVRRAPWAAGAGVVRVLQRATPSALQGMQVQHLFGMTEGQIVQ